MIHPARRFTSQLEPLQNELSRLRKKVARLEVEIARETILASVPGVCGFQSAEDFLAAFVAATGVSIRHGRPSQLRDAELRQQVEDGRNVSEIAKNLGVTKKTIYNRCAVLGLKTNR